MKLSPIPLTSFGSVWWVGSDSLVFWSPHSRVPSVDAAFGQASSRIWSTHGLSISMSISAEDGFDRPFSRQGIVAATASAILTATALTTSVAPSGGPSYDLNQERIFDTRKRSFLPANPERLIRAGFEGGCRLLCLGEVHTNPLHHRMQFKVIKALHAASLGQGEPLAIGLEMFYRQQQGALDRYVFLHGNLELLKLETQWEKTWGFDFNQYAKIFRFARENRIYLVGLNAPSFLVNLVNNVGLDGLPPELISAMPKMDLGQVEHRRRFEETINAFPHGNFDEAAMQRMYESQTLWDEYMAETSSRFLQHRGGRMVLLAGTKHIESRDGIPDRVQRRTGLRPFTVVPLSVEWTPDGLPDIDHPPGNAFADWVYYTEEELEPVETGQKIR